MPVSGLVLTLSANGGTAAEAISALKARPEIECEAPRGNKLPVAVDTLDRTKDQALWRWINELPGVDFIDVVFISFPEDEDSPEVAEAC